MACPCNVSNFVCDPTVVRLIADVVKMQIRLIWRYDKDEHYWLPPFPENYNDLVMFSYLSKQFQRHNVNAFWTKNPIYTCRKNNIFSPQNNIHGRTSMQIY